MIKDRIDSDFSKSKGLIILEYFLFAVCLCVIGIRTTFTEGLNVQSASQSINLGDNIYSLLISAVLFLSSVVWLVWSFCSRKFLYRFTDIELGLGLFAVAAVIAGLAASDKRAAITAAVCLIAPVLMAVLLVQLLDSALKIKLLLICITALGVVSAYECADQLFFTNQAMIDQYEQAPQRMLEPLGIQPNTLQHWQFQHRLYTRGVRGFFTTSNSAGSFALLASFAAVGLFLEKVKNRKIDASGSLHLVLCGIVAAVVLFGLAITQSKGAITAFLTMAAVFVVLLYSGNWLRTHKNVILIAGLLLILAGGSIIVWYGLAQGRLPGGNSMLVRWQYWCASVRMYADHWLTGIGPGNFANFYSHYKPAAALESVADPHNFLLSILTGYGPLGLVGFLAMIFAPLWRVSLSPALLSPKAHRFEPAFKRLAILFAIVMSVCLLAVRPMLLRMPPSEALSVTVYVTFILYVTPVIIFVAGFWLLSTNEKVGEAANGYIIAVALFCACLGVILHNLIDFAVFEPGVFTTLWAVIAALIALDFQRQSRTSFIVKPASFIRVIVVVTGLIIVWAYFNYCLIPVAKASAKILSTGRFQKAHELLSAAAEDDRLSPAALSLNGKLYIQNFLTSGSEEADLLLKAQKCLLGAIERDRADFRNFERLAESYTLLAEISTQQQRSDWLNKAFDSISSAVERCPGLSEPRIEIAEIAEKLGKAGIAVAQYEKAIEIEDAYQRQFRIMYPRRVVFSRLGYEKYNLAKQRIESLSKKPPQ